MDRFKYELKLYHLCQRRLNSNMDRFKFYNPVTARNKYTSLNSNMDRFKFIAGYILLAFDKAFKFQYG